MRVYKLEVMIVDTDDLGPQDVVLELENTRWPNRCITPRVVSVETREVKWSDEHPLNQRGWQDAFRKLFTKEPA